MHAVVGVWRLETFWELRFRNLIQVSGLCLPSHVAGPKTMLRAAVHIDKNLESKIDLLFSCLKAFHTKEQL